jgi:hypothetical protein
LQRLLRDQIAVKSISALDMFGQPTSTSNTTVSARVMHEHKRSRDVEGEEFLSTTQVVTMHPVDVGDSLTIDGQERKVRAVKRIDSLRVGVTLTEAHL